MATERCPVCGVSLKAENLVRHLEAQHPRDAKASAARAKLRRQPGRATPKPRGLRFRPRPVHYAAVAAVVLVILAVFFIRPTAAPFTVDSCISDAGTVYHIHPRLSIIIEGNRYTIPRDTGISQGCIRPLHTHADYDPATEAAILHVESPVVRTFTLGEFFHVWGKVLTSTDVVGYTNGGGNVVRMVVDGSPSDGFGALPLVDGQQIVITYGP